MRRAAWLLGAGLAVAGAAHGAALTPVQKQLREIYQELVETNTTDSVGSCTVAATRMAKRLKAAGYGDADLRIVVPPGGPAKGNLVARLKGDGSAKPLLLLAHIDVVEAKREDWTRDPFKLVEEDGVFYARGASDDKAMAASFVANMIRYKKEKLAPKRDLVMALTCDEELVPSKFDGVDYLLKHHRPLIDAELALNEGGGGLLDKNDKPVRHGIQAGEKVYQSFQLEVTNPGGHSSTPYRDNAIYHLADGLSRLGQFAFPFKLSDVTRAFYQRMSTIEQGQVAADMKAILSDPPDQAALERLYALHPTHNSTVRTTCVATRVDAGHADNALPQRARATVNCRILPGEPIDDRQIERAEGAEAERRERPVACRGIARDCRRQPSGRAVSHRRGRDQPGAAADAGLDEGGRRNQQRHVAGRAGGADDVDRRHRRSFPQQRRHLDLWHQRHVSWTGGFGRAWLERAYTREVAVRRPGVPVPAGQAAGHRVGRAALTA